MKWIVEIMAKNDRSRASRLNWLGTRSASFRLWQRIDPVWLSIALSLLAAMVLLGLVFGGWRPMSGEAEPVPDNRIVGSLTADRACFVEAATDLTGDVWASLSGTGSCASATRLGGVARYDPVWRLWGDEVQPFARDWGGIRPDSLARLDGTVWVAGDDGGLARLEGREWTVWLSQSRVEIDGRPLDQTQIVSATPLQSGAGLLIAAGAGRVFLYTATTSAWRSLGDLPGEGKVQRILLSGQTLWIQRDAGLWTARYSAGDTALGASRLVLDRPVLSLVAIDDGVLVLSRVDCEQQGEPCVALDLYGPDGTGTRSLLDTSTAPYGWRAGDVDFVATLGASIVIAGPRGAWAYRTSTRRWARIEAAPVTAFVAHAGDLVALGGNGFVTRIDNDVTGPIRHTLPGQGRTVVSLSIASDRTVHASDAMGSLWLVPPTGAPRERFRRTLPQPGQAARAAISSDVADLFVLSDGVLSSMDRSSRRYRNIVRPDLAAILASSMLRTFNGSPIFAAGGTGATQVALLDPSRPEEALVVTLEGSGGIRSLGAVDSETALVTTAQGRVVRLSVTDDALTAIDLSQGQPGAGPSVTGLRDIGRLGGDLLVAGPAGVSRYDPVQRTWQQVTDQQTLAADGSPDGEAILAVDDASRLLAVGADGDSPPTTLMGARSFGFPADAGLEDALLHSELGLVLMADDGRGGTVLDAYDPITRRSRALAQVANATGDGEVLALDGPEDWLIRIGSEAFRTADTSLPLADRSAGVIDGWIDRATGQTVTLEIDSETDTLFLHRHGTESNAETCLYRGSTAQAAQGLEFQALDDETFVLSGPTSLQFYRTDAGRWFEARLGPGTVATTPGYGAYWAQRTDEPGELVRFDLGLFDRVLPSCAAETPTLARRAFEMGAVAPGADRVLHRGEGGEVLLSEEGGRDRVLFRPPSVVLLGGPPLRALLREEEIWLAFSAGVMRYDLATRTWTRVADIPAEDWVQVTLEEGTGAFAGSIIAGYATADRWQSVRIPTRSRDPGDAVLRRGRFVTPAALPSAVTARRVEEAWSDESFLYVRLEDRLLALDRHSAQWLDPGWPIRSGDERLGLVAGRIISWSARQRLMRHRDGARGTGRFGQPESVTVPTNAQALVTSNGTPAWVTVAGGLVMCRERGACRQALSDPRLFDPDAVARAMDVGSGFVVFGSAGGATFLRGRAQPQPQRLFGTASPPAGAPFVDWLTEEIVYFWPSRSGDAYFAQSASGRVVRIDDRDRENPVRVVPEAGQPELIAFNPEDELSVYSDGRLNYPGGEPVLANGVAPVDIRALGVLNGDIWLQLPDVLLSYAADCRRPALPDTVIPEGAEPPDCIAQTRVAPVAETPIAHLIGSWEEALAAVLKSSERLQFRQGFIRSDRWSRDGSVLPMEVDLREALAEVIYRRPDGSLSFDQGVRQTSLDGDAITLQLPNGESFRFVDPASLTAPQLDLGWLRFERATSRFVFGAGQRQSTVAADAVFSDDGRFMPFLGLVPLPQPDGSLIVATPFGVLSARDHPTLAQDRPAGAFQSIDLQRVSFQTDAGGLWQDERFFPVNEGNNSVESTIIDEQLGALTVVGDRRRPGVRIDLRGVDAWRNGRGFAWDDLRDLGWSENDLPVMDTGAGPVLVNDPLAVDVPTGVAWSARSFARLDAAHNLRGPPAGYSLTRTPRGLHLQLLRDALIDATGDFDELHLATRRGYERAANLSSAPELLARADDLDGFETHRPSGTLLVGRVRRLGMVLASNEALQPVTDDVMTRLSDPLQYEIGALDIMALDGGQYRLEISPFRNHESPRPALVSDPRDRGRSRFAMDVVNDVAFADDGTLITISAAGLTVSADEQARALQETRLISPADANRSFSFVHRDGELFVLERVDNRVAACATIMAGANLGSCEVLPQASRVTFGTVLGLLSAEQTGNEIRFLLDPRDGGPELPVSFSDGRLAIDRVMQVAACGRQIHLVLEAGLHAAHTGMTGAWQEAEMVSRIDGQTLMVCTEGHPDTRITNALLLGGPNGQWQALSLDGTNPESGNSHYDQTAVIAMLNGPRLSDGRTLLRADAESELTHDAREGFIRNLRIGGQMERLMNFERLGPAAAVDAPRFFIAGGERTWAVTEQALYPFGPATGTGPAALERDGPRRTPLPEACQTPLTAHWVSPSETDLLCEGGVRVVLSFDPGGITSRVVRTPRPDVAQLGELRLAAERGQALTGIALAGEALGPDAFDGGFAFDRFVTMAWAGERGLSVVSEAGWHSYEASNLSLGTTSGLRSEAPTFREMAEQLRLARSVHPTHTPNLHCFSVAHGASREAVFIDFTENRPQMAGSRSGGCTHFLAADSLREAWLFPSGRIRFFHRLGVRRTVQDTLTLGRFDGDRVGASIEQALPILGQSPNSNRLRPFAYCVPSRIDGLAIAGSVNGASARVVSETCSPQRQAAPSQADSSQFFVEGGTLYRRRLLED